MDRLVKCAFSYQKMLNLEYHMIIARKGKTLDLKVSFNVLNFHHLAGIHKLKDLTIATSNREKVFNDILSSKITLENIRKSNYSKDCLERINFLGEIESLFDKNNLIFNYNEKLQMFSVIQADFLLTTPLDGKDVYIFLSKDNNDKYFCRSFFPKGNKDYTKGQARYTLLYKEKINLLTGETIIQYDKLHK